jgi:hypothetical protein
LGAARDKLIDCDSIHMPAALIVYRFIWTLNLVASALVIWRLFSLGLHKQYRFFFASMALAVARTAVLFMFRPSDTSYYFVWLSTQPLLWLSYILVVAELYFLVFRKYRGIYSLGRWFFFGAVFLSVVISALTVLPGLANDAVTLGKTTLLYYYASIERGIVTSLATFLLLLLVFVSWFSVPLSSNLLRHSAIYSAYFFASNVAMLYWKGSDKAARVTTLSKLSVGFVCLLCWVFFLSRRGEDRIASLHLGRNAIAERKLLTQLENLNATLLRTARK